MTTRPHRGAALSRELIRRMPKPELHVHLDGSLRPTTLVELAREQKVKLPTNDIAELTRYLHVSDARNLMDYLARFEVTLSVLQVPEALERVAYELVQDGAADGVRYMEIRYSPILCTKKGMPLPEAVEAPLRGMHRAEKDFGVRTGLIICGIRNMSPATSMDLANLTVAFKGRGVVAFDLAGAEYNYPAKKHREAFYTVVNANVAATIHAGEAYGPESIAQAVHYCGAHRIGHGVRLRENGDLLNYLNDHRIPLELCPSSNVQTRSVADFASHPLKFYFDFGLRVTINTDNRLITDTTSTKELLVAHQRMGLTLEDLCTVLVQGFKSAFLPFREKQDLLQRVNAEIAEVLARFGGPARLGAGAPLARAGGRRR